MNAERRPKGAAIDEACQPSPSLTARPHDLKEAALRYASLGWPVFPLAANSKVPAIAADRGGTGFKDATSDGDVIARWWSQYRDSNIGMATGEVFDVLDVDVKPAGSGEPLLRRLIRSGVLAGCVGTATTRNSGAHLYFPASGQGCHSLRFLDFKARGGYVVLPPSRVPADTPDGEGVYRWVEAPEPGGGSPLDWAAVAAILTPKPARRSPGRPPGRRSHGQLAGLVRTVAESVEGERNNRLFWAACRAFDAGLDVTPLVESARRIGLTGEEIATTVRNAERVAGGAR